eukprot:1885371-Prymnesium_polylepis.1
MAWLVVARLFDMVGVNQAKAGIPHPPARPLPFSGSLVSCCGRVHANAHEPCGNCGRTSKVENLPHIVRTMRPTA